MSLAPGVRIGPYEVVAPLGAGGMGEVYRARDTRLPREVALKVLRGDGVADADRVRRFEQEARALAGLNHPHILTMHDVLTHEGVPVVVTELLDGRTLRAELDAAPDRRVSVRRAAALARQVADGLSAGHSNGLAHRDLKPENVFVTTDGHVKVLDYGLAKAFGPAEGTPLAGPDGTTTATGRGTIVGTVGYMAPEQVRGEPVDHRADLFALGVMLHEMVSGTGRSRVGPRSRRSMRFSTTMRPSS